MAHIQATGFYMVQYDFSNAWIVTTRGDGTGVARLSITVASGCTLLLDGTARFYADAAGTLDESDTWTPTSGSLQTRYVRCPSGTANLVFNDPDLLLSFGHVTNWTGGSPAWTYDTTHPETLVNIPSLTIANWNYPNCIDIYAAYYQLITCNININQLSPSLLYFLGTNQGAISGDLVDLPLTTEIFSLFYTCSVTGDIANIPASIEYFRLGTGNTITGDITDLKEGLLEFFVSGSNTISGDIANLPSTLVYISLSGNNTVSGDLADFSVVLTNISISGNNTISGNIEDIKADVTYFYIDGDNVISGDLDNWPSDSVIATLRIAGSNTITGGFTALPDTLMNIIIGGSNTVDGLIEDIPVSVTTVNISGDNIIAGTLDNLPSGCKFTVLAISGNNIVAGDLANLPSTLLTVSLVGANTVYGDLNDLVSTLRSITLVGDNAIADYTPPSGGKTWYSLANSAAAFNFRPASAGGLSSTEVDDLIIDLDASTTTSRTNALTIYITGNNDARTSASDAAVASLLAHNITVVTN